MNNHDASEWAICGVGVMPQDAGAVKKHAAQDGLYSLTTRESRGTSTAVLGAIAKYLFAADDPQDVIEQIASPAVKIITLTITESAYVTDPFSGLHASTNPKVLQEVESGLRNPITAFGYIVAGLAQRRADGAGGLAVLSCDNIQHNGAIAKASVLDVARLLDPDLATWIEVNVAFPSSMVDRITPATGIEDIASISEELGVRDEWPVVSEPFSQWIVEDSFPCGRPALEKVGVVFVDDVGDYEALKLRLLNGSHQALAYVGQLAGYKEVHEAVQDPKVRKSLLAYMTLEVTPTLRIPEGFDVEQYIETLLERFSNEEIRDRLERLSEDSSSRVPKFVLPVILDTLKNGEMPTMGAHILALWVKYVVQATQDGSSGVIDIQRALLERAVEQATGGVLDRGNADIARFFGALPAFAELANYETFLEEVSTQYKSLGV